MIIDETTLKLIYNKRGLEALKSKSEARYEFSVKKTSITNGSDNVR